MAKKMKRRKVSTPKTNTTEKAQLVQEEAVKESVEEPVNESKEEASVEPVEEPVTESKDTTVVNDEEAQLLQEEAVNESVEEPKSVEEPVEEFAEKVVESEEDTTEEDEEEVGEELGDGDPVNEPIVEPEEPVVVNDEEDKAEEVARLEAELREARERLARIEQRQEEVVRIPVVKVSPVKRVDTPQPVNSELGDKIVDGGVNEPRHVEIGATGSPQALQNDETGKYPTESENGLERKYASLKRISEKEGQEDKFEDDTTPLNGSNENEGGEDVHEYTLEEALLNETLSINGVHKVEASIVSTYKEEQDEQEDTLVEEPIVESEEESSKIGESVVDGQEPSVESDLEEVNANEPEGIEPEEPDLEEPDLESEGDKPLEEVTNIILEEPKETAVRLSSVEKELRKQQSSSSVATLEDVRRKSPTEIEEERMLSLASASLASILPIKEGKRLEVEIAKRADYLREKVQEKVKEEQKEQERIDRETMELRAEYARVTNKKDKAKKRKDFVGELFKKK